MSTNLRYPYFWARDVVQGFVEKHARATWKFAKLVNCSPGDVRFELTMLLSKGINWKFESMKRAILLIDAYEWHELERFTSEERKLLYKWYLLLGSEEYLDREESRRVLDSLAQLPLSY